MHPFRKILALFLLMIFSFSGSAFLETVKVANLVAHYLEHNEKQGMSLSGFLKMHYLDENHSDDDDSEDAGLPFLASSPQANPAFTYPQTEVLGCKLLDFTSREPKIILEESFLNDPFTSRIWQPPRDC